MSSLMFLKCLLVFVLVLTTADSRPVRNVVIFLTEDQSADLGCMGTAGLATPAVDSFAKSGVLFERAFCLSPVCSPSKMAMFTGTFPHQNSACRNVPDYGTQFPLVGDPSNLSLGGVHEDLPTLVEILRKHGYFTATSHKSHVQPVRKWPYHKGYGQPTTPKVARSYINNLISSARGRPFYMTFGIGAPHLPFRGILKDQGKWSETGGLVGDGHATNINPGKIKIPDAYPDQAGVRQDFADYYGAIQCVDAVFAAVIAALRENAALDDTLVIYTSDHGIGLHRAKQSIYATGTRVPFIIAGPGIRSGCRIKAPVSHLDLIPTLLDGLGIPIPADMLGTSLMPILSGTETIVPGRKTIMTTADDKCISRAVCDGRYYYVRNIRKIAGCSLRSPEPNQHGIDPQLDRGLNTDQYLGGSPWFNRSFTATLAAEGSKGRQLLNTYLTGAVPDEELFDLDSDPWCVNDLANDPKLASLKAGLAEELAAWREISGDQQSPTPRRTGRPGKAKSSR